MPQQDLSFESIQQMEKFKEYTMLFKKRIFWKESKVRGVAFIKDYDGLKPKKKLIALPIHKPMTPVKFHKQLQAAGVANNKMAVCAAQLTTNEEGGLHLDLTPTKGSLAPAFIEQHGTALFKSYLKASLVLSTTPQAETEPTEEQNDPTTEISDQSDTPTTDTKTIAQNIAASIKALLKNFQAFKKDIAPRVKAGAATTEDQQFLQELQTALQTLKTDYEAAPNKVQQHPKLKGHYEQLMGQQGTISQWLQKAQQTAPNTAPNPERQQQLEQGRRRMEEIRQRIAEIKAQLAA